jgi:hypothetical protein
VLSRTSSAGAWTSRDGIHSRISPEVVTRATVGVRLVLSSPQALKVLPASFIGEAVAKAAHVIANGGPFRAADDADILDGKNGEEEVLVGAVVPILGVHDLYPEVGRHARAGWAAPPVGT